MVIGGTSPRLSVTCLLVASLVMLTCRGANAAEVSFAGEDQFGAAAGPESANYSQFPGCAMRPSCRISPAQSLPIWG